MKPYFIFFVFLVLCVTSTTQTMHKDTNHYKKINSNTNNLEFYLDTVSNNTNKDLIIEELPPYDTNYVATYGTKIDELPKKTKKTLNKKLNLESIPHNLVGLLKIYDENDITQALLVKISYSPQSRKVTTELTSLNNKKKEHSKSETMGLPLNKNGNNKALLKLTIEANDFKQSKIELVS